jgi:hypothetical protein
MAKDYTKFKAEWTTVLKEIDQGLADMKKNDQHVAQTTGVISEGAKEVGARVQELKAGGMKGKEINDFMTDNEIKVMMASITELMSSLEKELGRMEKLHSGPWVKSKARFWALRKELAAEIALRKKAKSTKLGLGNKSLSDMVKLLAEIDKVKESRFTTWDAFQPEEIAQHRRELNFKLQDEIAKAKDVRLTEYQAMMQEQGLNTRVLRGNFGKAKLIYQSILEAVSQAEAAAKAKKAGDLLTAKKEAARLNQDLIKIVDPYQKAPNDPWLRTRIAESKDKSAIETGIRNFVAMRQRAHTAVAKLDDLKV